MTFSAADIGFIDVSMSLVAIRRHLDASLESRGQWTMDDAVQLHKLTCIGLQNSRHGTSAA